MKGNGKHLKEMENYLFEKVQHILGDSNISLNRDKNFMDMGVDSSSLVILSKNIEEDLGIRIIPTIFFEYQNIKELAEYFANESVESLEGVVNTKSEIQTIELEDEEGLPPLIELMDYGSITSATAEVDDDIAIIGMAGMVGGSKDLDAFWNNLVEGKDLITEIPNSHFDFRPWYDSDVTTPDKIYCKWGSFIDDVDKFDASFFNVSPKEAEVMDPQLRLLLQVIYATAEDAGYGSKIRGSKTGMYVGNCFHDYELELARHMDEISPYFGIGNALTMLANRPSYYFDLKGPSMSVDTACSASLVALHVACKALKAGECEMAFVSGANLLLSPTHYRYFCTIDALSHTGRCHTFDHKADGYIPGESVSSILIKPLKQALADGDRVHAVIKGSAVNHGGYTPSVTAPSVLREAQVIMDAWENAEIDPQTIGYIECHGTGTKLGDPIEINAIKHAFGQYSDKGPFCAVGSAKAHVGHAEGAAGILGIIKLALSLKNKKIPSMPKFEKINPYIDLEGSPIYINRKTEEWKKADGIPRRGGVSSFGIGGAYAHVVLEEYVNEAASIVENQDTYPCIVVLSAKDEERLKEQAQNLMQYIGCKHQDITLVGLDRKELYIKVLESIRTFVADILEVSEEKIDLDCDARFYGIDYVMMPVLVDRINQRFDLHIMPNELASLHTLSDIAESLAENHSQSLFSIFEGEIKEPAGEFKGNPNLSLSKVAYTLQVGREQMEERLAVVVSSLEELYDKLNEYISGSRNSGDIFTGSLRNMKSRNEVLFEAFGEVEGRNFLYTLIENKKTDILARLWVSGVPIDWESLYSDQKPGIVSLPTYPFAKERYWAECLEQSKNEGWFKGTVAVTSKTEEKEVSSESTTGLNGLGIENAEVKNKVTKIWKQFLGVKDISVNDDYLELGGNSIITTQIINSLAQTFGIEVSSGQFLEAGNIETLAGVIVDKLSNRNLEEEPSLIEDEIPLTIMPRNNLDPVPLSSDQERLWFMHLMYPDNTSHNIPAAYKVKGEINVEILKKAIKDVVNRHQSLRTTFSQANGNSVQVINDSIEISFDLITPNSLSEDDREENARASVLKSADSPFNMEYGPLVRFGLIRMDKENSLLFAVIHHIIADIWSLGILLQEILKTYEAFVEGKQSPLPLPRVHYPDYVVWMHERQADILNKHLDYWKEKLGGAPELTKLPLDKARPVVQSFKASQIEFSVPDQVLERIRNLCVQNKASLYIVLLTAFKAMLARVSGQEDILVGSPVANRSYAETRDMIGFLANTLVFRTKLDADSSFTELINSVKEVVYGAFDHQEVTFSQIVEAIKPKRAANYNPLFQVMFNHVVIPDGFQDIKAAINPVDLKLTSLDFDIMLRMEERQGELIGFFDYNPDLFNESTALGMVDAFQGILHEVADNESVRISMLKIPQLLEDKKQAALQKESKHHIILSSTFTDETLKETLEFWSEKLDLPVDVQFAPYNQVFQQLLDPNSLLRKNQSGANIVSLRFEDWLRYDSSSNEYEKKQKIQNNINELSRALVDAASNTKVPLLVVLCPSNSGYEYPEFFDGLNEAVAKASNLHMIVPEEIEDKYPVAEIFDRQADQIGHVPFTQEYYAALGTIIFRKIYSLKRPPYKVIVLDCDNTLWTGVCGEVGPKGIKLGSGRLKFQEQLLRLKQSGMILALCSKNSEEDVMKVFQQKRNMILKLDDIVAWKINWLPKSQNIRELAKELNLGLDSFIFMDDNPVECAEVSANCPEVLTFQVPQNNHELEIMMKHLWACDITRVTDEDKRRTQMYRQNVEREQALKSSSTFEDFLKSLLLKVDIADALEEDFLRVEQLLQKTNQFNATTRRHSAEQIRTLVHTGTYECQTVKVRDRFGDYGLVGVMLYQKMDNHLAVDSFLLSCRVLGKGVEHEMVRALGNRALALGMKYVSIEFIESAKNTPAKEFLQGMKGQRSEADSKGIFHYQLTAEEASGLSFNPSKEGSSETQSDLGDNHQKKSIVRAEASVLVQMYKNYQTASSIRNAVDDSLKLKNSSKVTANLTESQPIGEVEKMIADVYKAILHLENISTTSNFFDIGGTSLLLVELSSRLKNLTNKELTIIDLFKYPTVKSLAAYLGSSKQNVFDKSKNRGLKQRQTLSQLVGSSY